MFKTLLPKTTTMLISTASPAMCFAAGTQAAFIFLLWLLQFSTPSLLLGLLNKIWDRPVGKRSKKEFSEDLEKQLQGCTMLVELRVPIWPLFFILYHVCICLFSFQGPCLALPSAMSTQGWILNISAGIGYCRVTWGGRKEMTSLVGLVLTMKGFEGWQQLGTHLEAQRQPAHAAEQQRDVLWTKVQPCRQVATGSPSKWLLRAALSGAGCCNPKWQSQEELYHVPHPILPGPTNADESLLFARAASWASSKSPKLWA